MPLLTAALLVTSTMGAEERGRASMPLMNVVSLLLMNVVLVESLMRVITSAHANTWHMVVQITWELVLVAMLASTRLSFHAVMEPVSVREASLMRRDFLISVAHRLPLHHPPPRYVYFLMLSIYALRPIYQTLTIVSIFIFHPFSPPGALSRHHHRHHLPIRLR